MTQNAIQNKSPMENAIDQVIEQCGSDQWGECNQYPSENWRYEVENGETFLGYWEWVIHQAEADQVELETLTGQSYEEKNANNRTFRPRI